MSFDLPPLNTLRMFEAAGRLLSFKAAAEELNVTPSAVSHGIMTLETWLGTPLFVRRRPGGVALTDAASHYLPLVHQALRDLAAATDRVPGRKPRGCLVLSVAPSFAGLWLLPRMPRFSDMYPGVSIRIDTTLRQVNLPLDGTDLVIRMTSRRQAGGIWLRLMKERLVPVIAPALWREVSHMPVDEIMRRLPWLHVTTVRRDWHDFAGQDARTAEQARSDLRFDTIHMALQAARQGLGLALGRRPLIDDDLEAERLIPLPVAERSIDTAYWLVGQPATFERPEVKAFRAWLVEEIRSTERKMPPQKQMSVEVSV